MKTACSKFKQIVEKCTKLSISLTPWTLYVDIRKQRLHLQYQGRCLRRFIISTSRRRPSCIEDSYGTPVGLHAIADKIGDDAPLGMVFRSRQPIGKRYWECDASLDTPPGNAITTRILRLKGLEAGFNQGPGCDTYDRYIYFHGTNREDRLGRRVSAGCVLLSNHDILDLYNQTPKGSLVLIGNSARADPLAGRMSSKHTE